MRCRTAAVALCIGGFACIDFGVPPGDAAIEALDAATTDAEVDAGAPCEEGPVDPALAENTINIVRFSVDPLEITIAAGTVLAWTNTDTRNHRMLAGTPDDPILPENGGFNSNALPPGASYAHRFCAPRLLLYYCSSHPGTMNGYRIVIE